MQLCTGIIDLSPNSWHVAFHVAFWCHSIVMLQYRIYLTDHLIGLNSIWLWRHIEKVSQQVWCSAVSIFGDFREVANSAKIKPTRKIPDIRYDCALGGGYSFSNSPEVLGCNIFTSTSENEIHSLICTLPVVSGREHNALFLQINFLGNSWWNIDNIFYKGVLCYAPGLIGLGHIYFVLSVCLSVVNFKVGSDFLTIEMEISFLACMLHQWYL